MLRFQFFDFVVDHFLELGKVGFDRDQVSLGGFNLGPFSLFLGDPLEYFILEQIIFARDAVDLILDDLIFLVRLTLVELSLRSLMRLSACLRDNSRESASTLIFSAASFRRQSPL